MQKNILTKVCLWNILCLMFSLLYIEEGEACSIFEQSRSTYIYNGKQHWKESLESLICVIYTCWTNSGLRKEKPANSFWSRFIMNSLSVGVRSVPSLVNCRSKFDTSLRWRWNYVLLLRYFDKWKLSMK